jgi:hypothetical protein
MALPNAGAFIDRTHRQQKLLALPSKKPPTMTKMSFLFISAKLPCDAIWVLCFYHGYT